MDKKASLNDFIPGMKISLRGECGLVLPKASDSELIGLIRWDTEKDNDIEDWRGLYGTFLQVRRASTGSGL